MEQILANYNPDCCEDIRDEVGLGTQDVSTDSRKILKRDSNFVRSEAGRKPWEERYAERMSCLEQGLMTPLGRPYKDLGDEVDTKQFQIEALIKALPTELQEWYQENIRAFDTGLDDEKISLMAVYEDVDMGNPFRFRTAGMSLIQEKLDESAERLVSTRCGQPYLELLDKIKKRKQREAEIQSELDAQLPIVRKLSLGTLARKIYNRQLYSDSEEAGGEGEKEEEEEEEEEEEREEEKEEEMSGKGETLNSNVIDCRFEIEQCLETYYNQPSPIKFN